MLKFKTCLWQNPHSERNLYYASALSPHGRRRAKRRPLCWCDWLL